MTEIVYAVDQTGTIFSSYGNLKEKPGGREAGKRYRSIATDAVLEMPQAEQDALEGEERANGLDSARDAARQIFRKEALGRIGAQVPSWGDENNLRFIVDAWNMLGTPNAQQLLARNLFLFRERRRAEIDAMDAATATAFDSTSADPFGDGDGWPT